MKRIISFVLCLSMLLSMLPVSVFATEVEQTTPVETTPVTEVLQETETAAATEAPETTAETAETAMAKRQFPFYHQVYPFQPVGIIFPIYL